MNFCTVWKLEDDVGKGLFHGGGEFGNGDEGIYRFCEILEKWCVVVRLNFDHGLQVSFVWKLEGDYVIYKVTARTFAEKSCKFVNTWRWMCYMYINKTKIMFFGV